VKQEELIQLADRARRMAYRIRHLEQGGEDSEQVARAWERLGEAAFALEAVCARRFACDPPRRSLSWVPSPRSSMPESSRSPAATA
jgi:hypothetical protein